MSQNRECHSVDVRLETFPVIPDFPRVIPDFPRGNSGELKTLVQVFEQQNPAERSQSCRH
jgi:hypothetical protein